MRHRLISRSMSNTEARWNITPNGVMANRSASSSPNRGCRQYRHVKSRVRNSLGKRTKHKNWWQQRGTLNSSSGQISQKWVCFSIEAAWWSWWTADEDSACWAGAVAAATASLSFPFPFLTATRWGMIAVLAIQDNYVSKAVEARVEIRDGKTKVGGMGFL